MSGISIKQPNGILHRLRVSMAVFALLVLLVAPMSSFAASPFTEVPRDHWSYKATERLYSLGLVTGDAAGFYRLGYAVSRYEMAMWVSSALRTMQTAIAGTNADTSSTARVANSTTYYVDIDRLVYQYNAVRKPKPLTTDDAQILHKLASFLGMELQSMGYAFAPAEQTMFASSIGATGLAFDVGNHGTFTVGPTVDLGLVKPLDAGQPAANPMFAADSKNPLGLGFTLELGDFRVTAGKGVSVINSQNGGTTALGVRYSLPNLHIQVGYASQETSADDKTTSGGWRTASAGVEVAIDPASRAGAGLSLTADPVNKTTTTNVGLSFQQRDASLSLGYRLIDLSAAQDQGQPDVHNNVATAEITIRF